MKHTESCRPLRDLSREDKEKEAAKNYEEDMARLNRIIEERKKNLEQAQRE